jgi:hypothetical protein
MNKGIQENETYRMEYPDGEWIEIKAEFSQEDEDDISTAMLAVETHGKHADVSTRLGKMATLKCAIRAWSLPIPINDENISHLKRMYRIPLLQKIDELNPTDFSKNSPKAST